jgi:hypothetical protein
METVMAEGDVCVEDSHVSRGGGTGLGQSL